MKFYESDMFYIGFFFGCVSGYLVACVVFMLLQNKTIEQSFQSKLDDAGIRLEHHYIEKDGVRTNWTDVVFINKGPQE